MVIIYIIHNKADLCRNICVRVHGLTTYLIVCIRRRISVKLLKGRLYRYTNTRFADWILTGIFPLPPPPPAPECSIRMIFIYNKGQYIIPPLGPFPPTSPLLWYAGSIYVLHTSTYLPDLLYKREVTCKYICYL